jgi:hypothetical protein
VKRLLLEDAAACAAFMRGDGEAVHALREADEIYLLTLDSHFTRVPQILTHYIP